MALQEEFKTQGDFLFKHRSFLPLVILVIGMAVFIYTEYYNYGFGDIFFPQSNKFICLGICLLGLFIRVKTVGHTPVLTSGRNTTEGQIASELNSTGIYSVVRHPLYLGNFFMWLGVAMLAENFWFIMTFILFYYVYYERIMYAEEAFLRNKFGDAYLKWAEKVPAFIPSFKHSVKSKYSFSIKKSLKQEKNGFAAVFLLFWAFELVGDFIASKQFKIEFDFWFYTAIISTVIYFILKIMKKRKMLNEVGR